MSYSPDVLGFYAALGVDVPDRPGNVDIRCFLSDHEDRHASASLSTDSGLWNCHGCSRGGRAYHAAVALGRSEGDAAELCKRFGLWEERDPDPFRRNGVAPPLRAPSPDPLPTEEELSAWRERLLSDRGVLARLLELRGWTLATIEHYGLGLDRDRIVIPVRGPDSQLESVLRYKPGERAAGERKMLAPKGWPRGLFPAPETVQGDPLWLVEGEPDVLAARELELAAVGIPGVEYSKRASEWAHRFGGRTVNVCLDCDEQGRAAAQRIARALAPHAAEVRHIDLEANRSDGLDLTDCLLQGVAASNGDGRRQVRLLLERVMAETPPVVAGSATETVDWSTTSTVAPEPRTGGEQTKPREAPTFAETEADGARAIPVSAFKRERVEWLWPGRIPRGALTLLVGDPGLGKSLLTCLIASKASRGGAAVLMATAEDSIAATVRPRLEAVGADLDRVQVVQIMREGIDEGLALPDNVGKLDRLVAKHKAVLVVIDPLMAHLPEGVNSWRDQSVRRALAPLHRLAEERGCAVVVIAHLNKGGGGDPLYRIGGSIGITGAARSALLLARDPEDPEGDQGSRRALAHIKCNLAPLAPSLACHVEPVLLDGDEREQSARLVLGEELAVTGAELLQRPDGDEERSAVDDAEEFLRAELAGSGAQPANAVLMAARDIGIAEKTLRRACRRVGVQTAKTGLGGPWVWSLPEDDQPEGGHIPDVAIFDRRAENGRKRPEDGQAADMATFGHDVPVAGESGQARERHLRRVPDEPEHDPLTLATPEQEAEGERMRAKFNGSGPA